jgi:predicted Zn-dependent protease with MMP-like domain
MRHMSRLEFEDLVVRAMETLPEEFLARLENVDVVVADRPTAEQIGVSGVPAGQTLLGLYEGVPLVDRENYGLVVPDKITVFQLPIVEMCSTREELIDEVRVTVVHEVAHFFGLDDRALREMGLG